ncbi:ankyrin repeat domain-containing protein [Lacinutrix sp.]|uniref:ankyrin repeat domain-containing protein n=1 Tax=Lacinutrix sp. TaxID=1937692 RepID=UPI0025BB5F78|nr:ankyrin repeat domain-containing protein [Lacinutrix sp.]
MSVFSQKEIFEVCRTGSLEDIAKLYEEDNTVINKINENGYSTLTLASYSENIEVVSFLVNKVKDINGNSDYGTPLMAATYKGNVEIVELLLNNNAITDLQDQKGETAAHLAVMFKKIEILKLLVEAKADFEIKNNNEKSPIDYAKLYNDNKINELLKL